jgi:hypothetical protein
MNDKYIILDSEGKFINAVVWNGDTSAWQPPEGTTAVPLEQVDPNIFVTEKYTAEQWITKSGYTATRLISLLDLEMKLLQSNKTSDKMIAVRQWLNSLLQAFATDPTSHVSWAEPPYSFEETVQEALTVLSA